MCRPRSPAPPLALIVQPRARRALDALLKLRAPSCLVLSIAELPVSQAIEVVAVIGGPAPARPPGQPAALPHSQVLSEAESVAA
ncbi:hypothetical protein [Novosphingobium sp.]|uniref:hypothetical protein n=1 Tax=Novosphingobium sp. TaxID=1874826 RepID=UPI003524EE50